MFQRQKTAPVTRRDISEARFKRFMRELTAYERKVRFEETLNAFLDVYSAWMKSRDPMLKVRVVMLAFELHRLEPSFECQLAFTE